LKGEHPGNMPWLFFLAACAIPTFYAVGLIARTGDNFTTTEFWRFWVVHLWVGFWNFLGAGIFGFLINLPIVSYYEIGTALTANHGHAAMMGVYGMLALGLAMFCLRYLIPAERWPERWAKICFWSTNIGLAWMRFATLLPLGILQLYKSVDSGYFEARELKFLTNHTNAVIEWLRLPGDVLFIVGGALPAVYIAYLGVRYTVKQMTLEQPDDILFTEIQGAAPLGDEEAAAARDT
jgi:nitric oxide reductase subunit B